MENTCSRVFGSPSWSGVLRTAQALELSLGECLRGEGLVALVEKCRAARGRVAVVAAGGEQMREQGWRKKRGWDSGARPAWNTRGPGRRGLRILRLGVVAAGLRHGWAAQGTGEGDAADNDAPHRAAEAADEACTNPLGGLGGTAGDVERGWHRVLYSISAVLCQAY